jgi:hypothetical protein
MPSFYIFVKPDDGPFGPKHVASCIKKILLYNISAVWFDSVHIHLMSIKHNGMIFVKTIAVKLKNENNPIKAVSTSAGNT